ncbi:MAG: hypothetical protein LUC97_11475 [Clostridiales bacterium]|nr:hypothetical protein [Clostridiales bacterium]
MGVFDFDSCCGGSVSGESSENNCSKKKIKDECLIALKVYDFFRIQECLTSDVLGYARAAEDVVAGETEISAGEIIVPPSEAASVVIEDLEIKSLNVFNKKRNTFKNGYYDVDLQFVFIYNLIFSEAGGCVIASVPATNTFSTKVTLFGSIDTDVTLSTDLFGGSGCSNTVTLNANPFVWIESKAVALAADLVYPSCCSNGETSTASDSDPVAVKVTIGLFAIIKLFRLVNLMVESKGFCIPEEMEDISATDPCDFFESLDFPMDSFAPPQKPEFLAGISSNIPASESVSDENESNSRRHCCCG